VEGRSGCACPARRDRLTLRISFERRRFSHNVPRWQVCMPTEKQVLGRWGETLVAKKFACPRCKRFFTLRRLPPNFKCADVICDFCGYLAQVKTATVTDVLRVPSAILGAAWGPQRERMKAGIYFPLFLVLRSGNKSAVYYVPTEFQKPTLFKKRLLFLRVHAERAGKALPMTSRPSERKLSCVYCHWQLRKYVLALGGAVLNTGQPLDLTKVFLRRLPDIYRTDPSGDVTPWFPSDFLKQRSITSSILLRTPKDIAG
jgi:type II restriction enzyme